MATDYHTKPVLAGRVGADIKAWAQDEAKRREQPFGDFLENLLVAERDRMVDHVVDCPHRLPPGAWCKTCKTAKPEGGKR